MFDTLLQLPLFQGLSQEDFTNILAKVKLDFTKHKANEILAKAGTPCNRLVFILKGQGTFCTSYTDVSYTVSECFAAPYVIEPHSLFGLSTDYVATYHATDEVHAVTLSKQALLDELFNYEICRLNYMNIISHRAQAMQRRFWSMAPLPTEKRIAHFILTHVERPIGEKSVKIKMEVLAQLINETRMTVSRALNNMQSKELLELHRGEIVVPEAALLAELLED